MYYIFELQKRPDGVINVKDTVARTTINSANSYYHERFSKMAMNTEFVSVSLLLTDENLNKVEHHIVKTMYVPPVEETTTETAEEVSE